MTVSTGTYKIVANAIDWLNYFEDCPNEKAHLQGLVETMRELQNELGTVRNQYKQKVYSCLSQNHPFPTNGTVESDVSQYVKLVGHCLYAGDNQILEEWGINPIIGDLSLLSSDDFALYSASFEDLAERSEEALEQEFYIFLRDFFYSLAEQQPVHASV